MIKTFKHKTTKVFPKIQKNVNTCSSQKARNKSETASFW